MKFSLALLVALAATAIPQLASSQTADRVNRPLTDAQSSAALHREVRGIGPDAKRKSPLAYGYLNPDGTTASGSGNFTSSYNSSTGWYTITITGVNYFFSNFATTVTPTLPRTTFCDSDSSGGSLLVLCFDTSGNPIQAEFGFMTF